MEYYIISLKHTFKLDKVITLWRPENAGYCMSKESAGLYESPKKGYHDSETNMPIVKEVAELLFKTTKYDSTTERLMIPNTPAIRKILRVRNTKDGLKKIVTHEKEKPCH